MEAFRTVQKQIWPDFSNQTFAMPNQQIREDFLQTAKGQEETHHPLLTAHINFDLHGKKDGIYDCAPRNDSPEMNDVFMVFRVFIQPA